MHTRLNVNKLKTLKNKTTVNSAKKIEAPSGKKHNI